MISTNTRAPQEISQIFTLLSHHFSDAKIELDYQTPFQLLIAVVLSAQATDRSVNKVTQTLFQSIKTPWDLENISIHDLEKQIASIGLYKTKAFAIKTLAQQLIASHQGQVPSNFEDLLALQGVGRKTAHVVLSELFHHHVIAVDTHVYRVSRKLGLSFHSNRDHVGDELMAIIPQDFIPKAHHLLIFLGRRLCHARSPKCSQCFLRTLCPSAPPSAQ